MIGLATTVVVKGMYHAVVNLHLLAKSRTVNINIRCFTFNLATLHRLAAIQNHRLIRSKRLRATARKDKGLAVATKGVCSARVQLCNRTYDNVKFTVMNGLLWDVILGREFLKLHESVQFNFGPLKMAMPLVHA